MVTSVSKLELLAMIANVSFHAHRRRRVSATMVGYAEPLASVPCFRLCCADLCHLKIRNVLYEIGIRALLSIAPALCVSQLHAHPLHDRDVCVLRVGLLRLPWCHVNLVRSRPPRYIDRYAACKIESTISGLLTPV